MPRRHKGPEAARKYDSTQRALADVQNNHMCVKKAAFLHCINHTTLMNQLTQLHCGPVGRPTLLALNEEKLIVHALQKLGTLEYWQCCPVHHTGLFLTCGTAG